LKLRGIGIATNRKPSVAACTTLKFGVIGYFMISNERPSPYGHQPRYQPHAPQPPRSFVQESTLKSGEIQIERNLFVMTGRENHQGRFLRITEVVGDKRNSIMIPAPGLMDFQKLVGEMLQASNEAPAKGKPAGT
jgi:hypothetical protein